MKQIKTFQNEHNFDLEKEVNEFCKTHNVISVSYAVQSVGYGTWYHACVLYDTNSDETNNKYDDSVYDETYVPADETFW